MRKIKFIINPAAGNGSSKDTITIIHDKMETSKLNYSISISSYKGHVELLSKEAVKDGYTDIIAVGGDGTVLEVFNGLFNNNVTLGIVPAGTGNDFVKMLNIDKDLEKSVDKIIVGATKVIDIGVVNNTHFLNVVGLGIDGEIVDKTEKVKNVIKGSVAYIYSTFAVLASYKCKKVKIEVDGVLHERECYLVAVGNGKYYGGGMMIAPDAEIDNESLEVVIINKISKLKFTILFRKVFSGKHIEEPAVEVFRGKKVNILTTDNLKINADGNIIGSGNCEISLLPKFQKVIV